jgi:hypothetical protein
VKPAGAVAVLLLLSACGKPDEPAPAVKAGAVRFVLSGDTRGFIVPCGCASKQLGGIPRRATYLEGLPKAELVYLDAGGTPHRASDYDRLKAGFIWRGASAMGVAALNVGASELAQGRDLLRELAKSAPLLSTNLADPDGPVPEIRLKAGGARIAVLGVCSKSYPPGPGLSLRDPAEALRGAVGRLRSEVDLLVLLAHAPEDELVELATSFPELDAVLATGPSQPIPPRLIEGRTVLAGTSSKGKFLAELPFEPQSGARARWLPGTGRIVELADTIAEAPAMTALVKEYQQALRTAELPPERTGERVAAAGPGQRYAGSEACGTCHTPDLDLWKVSKHAHGYETLVAKGFEADAYCLRCHTTGYGGPGGFRTARETAARGGVGCESCHGPSQAHAAEPLRVKTPVRAKDACLGCHDPENSPQFNYEVFWPRILHGKGRKPEAAPR